MAEPGPLPVDDTAGWTSAAGEAAGVLAVLSARLEPTRPGPLARAADAMAVAAQQPGRAHSTRPTSSRGLRGVAALAAHTAMPAGPAGWMLVMNQLVQMAHAIEAARRAGDAASAATARASAARAALAQVQARYAVDGPAPYGYVRLPPGPIFPVRGREHPGPYGRPPMTPPGPEVGR